MKCGDIAAIRNKWKGRTVASKCATRALEVISVRNCTRDEGRPLGVGLQEQAPNHLKLRW